MIKKSLPLTLIALLLTGCALTTEQVNLQYQPAQSAVTKVKATSALAIDPATDARDVSSNIIMHKTNEMGGEASGGYAAPKPIVTYLDEALKDRLSASGYHLASQAPYHLKSKLLSTRCYFDEPAFIGTATTYCSIQAEFSLNNTRTGSQVWDEALDGKGKASSDGNDAMATALNNAFNQLSNNLVENRGFQTQLK